MLFDRRASATPARTCCTLLKPGALSSTFLSAARTRTIENRIADIPARSHYGALVKLRVAAESYRLMGDIDDNLETRLTYQAWEALEAESFDFERLMRGLPS